MSCNSSGSILRLVVCRTLITRSLLMSVFFIYYNFAQLSWFSIQMYRIIYFCKQVDKITTGIIFHVLSIFAKINQMEQAFFTIKQVILDRIKLTNLNSSCILSALMKVIRIRNIASPIHSFQNFKEVLQLRRLYSTLQLVIINCKNCHSVIYKKVVSLDGLRKSKCQVRDVKQMKNVNVVMNSCEADIYCAQCQQVVGKISHIDQGIELNQRNVQTEYFHWVKKTQDIRQQTRKPFDLIGAASGFRVKYIYDQLYRLMYVKWQRYQLVFNQILKTVGCRQTRFKNFQCLINLIQNEQSKYSIKMVDFDRMMLSTTIQNCNMNSDIRSKQTPSVTISNLQVSKELVQEQKNP